MKEVRTMEQILKRNSVKQPFRALEKRVRNLIYKPFVEWYTSRESSYKYRDILVKVKPGVFHPRFFSSTGFLLEFFEFINFNRKKVLEIGSGSGLISIFTANEGANVTAIDICPLAVENTNLNVVSNQDKISLYGGNVTVLQSNLFENVPAGIFDLLILNPPFYQGDVKKPGDHAWYAGRDMEYFEELFSKCRNYMSRDSEMYMVLSEDCNFNKIFEIAKKNAVLIKAVAVKQFITENLYIFKITIPT